MPLSVGSRAPDFELENQQREKVRLSGAIRDRHVVLAFHPLAFTPVCAGEMCALRSHRERLDGLGARAFGISVDSTAAKAAWAASLGGLDFDLLSDFHPHGAVASAYGVFRPDGLAERAIFVVDRTGIIRFAEVYDIPHQPDLEPVFDALRRLQAS